MFSYLSKHENRIIAFILPKLEENGIGVFAKPHLCMCHFTNIANTISDKWHLLKGISLRGGYWFKHVCNPSCLPYYSRCIQVKVFRVHFCYFFFVITCVFVPKFKLFMTFTFIFYSSCMSQCYNFWTTNLLITVT